MSYDYIETLDGSARSRYEQKLRLIGLEQCPFQYAASLWKDDPTDWPDVTYPDIYSYLVESPGVFTKEAMKNYRSTDAWKMLQAGWVQRVLHMTTDTKVTVLKVKVMPSMRVNDPPHNAWAAVDVEGCVLAAHCNCKAGLCESCYHVGALLYKVEYANRKGYTKQVCTEVPCKWNNDFVSRVTPGTIKQIQIAQIAVIEKVKKENIPTMPTPPTLEEQMSLLQLLNECPSKPVVLSTYSDFAKHFKSAPVPPKSKLPLNLRNLYSQDSKNWTAAQEEKHLSDIMGSLKTDSNEIVYLQSQTLKQSNSLVWHEMRTGRITSSTAHQASRTSLSNPAVSLTKKICCPTDQQLNTAPIIWGREHEVDALTEYSESMSEHEDFKVHPCGLSLMETFPFIGASPDGMAHCNCCGTRMVEVKCPKSHEHCKDVDELFKDKRMPFEVDGTVKTSHQYYTQMQVHMLVYDVDSCDLVVWTPGVVVVRTVYRDRDFGLELVTKICKYFRQVILSELVTRKIELGLAEAMEPNSHSSTVEQRNTDPASSVFCFCKQPESEWDGEELMVACDNADCPYQWFHLRCLKRKTSPKGDWYCKHCRKPTAPPTQSKSKKTRRK